jgi:hypothetical protein
MILTAVALAKIKALSALAAKTVPLAVSFTMLRRLMAPPTPATNFAHQQLLLRAQAQEAERERQFRLGLIDRELSRRIVEREWPVRMSTEAYISLNSGTAPEPLVVILIPPDTEDEAISNEITTRFERSLREIVNLGYSPIDSQRPVRLLAGQGWRRGTSRGETALLNLWHMAPHVPTAIIQLDRIGPNLHLVLGQYGCGAPGVVVPPVTFQGVSANVQERAAELVREEGPFLRALAESGIDLTQLGEGQMLNLALLDAGRQSLLSRPRLNFCSRVLPISFTSCGTGQPHYCPGCCP